MASSSPSKISRKAAKRASEIKQGKQREFAEEVPEVRAPEQQQDGNDATAVQASEHKSTNGKMWPYIRLSESTGATRSLPAVFSKDGRFCFVASGASVKIYSVKSCQLLSSWNLPDIPSLPSKKGQQSSNAVTGVFLNPSNSLQLLTTSLDGSIRIWDYLDGRVLRTIDMAGPISLACISHNDGSEGSNVHSIYVGVLKQSERSSGLNTIVYQVNLNKREHPRKRLGKCKGASMMQVSNDGNHLVILGKRKIHIAVLADTASAANAKEGNFVSFDGFPMIWEDRHSANDVFTALSIHPSESYFATGDSKGVIRFWYLLNSATLATLQRTVGTPENKSKSVFSILPRKATSTVHWHAHGVSTLQFTPNGAYLLSGGEEAVLVVWQCQSRHKEFVPRLGGPISAVSITVSEGREQEFAIRFKDGSISFVGAGTLKVIRSIAGVKSLSDSQYISSSSSLPLAIEPFTSHLVFQASHPSSIQFFSPSLQAHLHELDISPGNRVSRTDERELEPVRVEKVAFAPVSSSSVGNGKVWMATFDTWQDRGYSRESHLKFWIGEPGMNDPRRYALNTRIDQPHGQERLSSLTFSSPSAGGQPRLATSSSDGSIKIWTNRPLTGAPDGIWQCSLSLSYRASPVYHLAFSYDGSLLAVAHPGIVTLWHTVTGKMIRSLVVPGAQSSAASLKVAFVGKDGSRLVAAGKKGTVVWDVLTCEEILSLAEPAEQLISDLATDAYTSTFADKAHTQSLSNETRIDLSELVFPLHEAAGYPLPSSTPSQALAGISKKGEVILTGPGIDSIDQTTNDAQNLRALAKTYEASDRPLRLFDEIFGASRPYEAMNAPQQSFASLSAVRRDGTDVFADTPTHRLPSIASLASGMLAQGLKPLQIASSSKASTSRLAKTVSAADDAADSDSDDQEEASRPGGLNYGEMDIDVPTTAVEAPVQQTTSYIDSPAGLAEVFKKNLAQAVPAVHGSTGAPGTPLGGKKDPRMAGNNSDRKALKKKKNLSSMFGGNKGTPNR